MRVYIELNYGPGLEAWELETLHKYFPKKRVSRGIGSYKGTVSPCYEIDLSGLDSDTIEYQLEVVYEIAKEHKQESVLLVTDRNLCFLVYTNREELDGEYIGEWSETGDVSDQDAWTCINERYYIAS